MSYQPNIPSGPPTPPPAPGGWMPMPPTAPVPPVAPVAPRRRGRALFWSGLAVLLVGVVAGITCIVLSLSATDDTVAEFARAPQGCTTTLEFDHTGTFTIYFERRGRLAPAGGDCDRNESSYDFAGDRPSIDLSLVDGNGDEVQIDSIRGGASYDTDRFEGVAIGRVRIDDKGEYDLSVAADAGVFAVAIGGDPAEDHDLLLGGGIILLAFGVAVGVVLVVVGRARGRHHGGGGAGSAAADRPMIPVTQYAPATPSAPRPLIPVAPPTSAPAAPPPASPPTWAPPTV